MKLLSFKYNGSKKVGILTREGIVDLSKLEDGRFQDMETILNNTELDQLKSYNTSPADYNIEDIEFLPVLTKPEKIICAGVNYDEHRLEADREKTDYPTIFFRVAESQIGHNHNLLVPKESDKLDYEGEIAIVIGKEGRRIEEKDALDYIAGYSCYNDATLRDWQRHAHQWGPGKNFNGTGAFGPYLVTKDEIDHETPMEIVTRVNGETMQKSNTDFLIFSIAELITYCSKFTTLKPGDVIVTGTPGGVGFKREPQFFLKEGDVVEIEVSQVGTLVNTVSNEK